MRYSCSFGHKTSKIMLGTAYFGDGISKDDAFAMMDLFRENGGTHIDTAGLYADGHSEEIVGMWIKDRKAYDMHVFTKGGYYEPDLGEKSRINKEDVKSDLNKSLEALGTDCIEFYWLHRDDESLGAEYIAKMMNDFIKEGKIKAYGASNWKSERIKAVNDYCAENSLVGFSASQIRFNPAYCLGERGGLVGMDKIEFDFYKKSGMPVVAYSSQAKGFFSKMAQYGEGALSEKARKRYLCPQNLEKLEVIKDLSREHECSVAALVCGAMCSFTAPDTFPVVGASSTIQLEDSIRGADIVLKESELRKIFKELKHTGVELRMP